MANANVDLFRNACGVAISGNTSINIHNHGTSPRSPHTPISPGAGPIAVLASKTASGCLYNAADRFDPPKCAPETREKILKDIEKWIQEEKHGTAALMWLFGAAGAGKSAIAQTTVENSKDKGLYVASFFFQRTGITEKSDGRRLLPTITLQVFHLFPNVRPRIEKVIRDDPHLFEKSIKNQMEQLLMKPLKSRWYRRFFHLFRPPKARLIVIDGLDECNSVDHQKEILQMLAETIPLLPYPFRFIVVSRPEAHIIDVFRKHPSFKKIKFNEIDLALDVDADKSIETYLRQCFNDLRQGHRLLTNENIGREWPTQSDIDNIVKKASGQFIYASTVIKYVGHPKYDPVKRLQVVLGLALRPVTDDPFAQLNILYMLIFDSASSKNEKEILQCFFGILYLSTLQHKYLVASPYKLESYLGLEKGGLLPVLDDFLSLIHVLDDLNQSVKIYHASLFDFLLDHTRSGEYGLDLGLAHRKLAEFFKPRKLSETDEVLSLTFLYHSQHATILPESDLRKYLLELPFLYGSTSITEIYWGYIPFIYFTYLSTLFRPEFNSCGESWYQFHLKKLLEKTESPTTSLQPVLSDLMVGDLGYRFLNDIHALFTKFVKWLLMFKNFPQPLADIQDLASRGLKDWNNTAFTLKHILLAALPFCHPSPLLYQTYGAFALQLAEGLKDNPLDNALRIKLSAFLMLSVPSDCDQDWQACKKAWALDT